jgi:hypothetical protein
MTVHRGRSKEGKKSLQIHLSQEEYESLKELAEDECRSATGQLIWLLKEALMKAKKGTVDEG